MKKKLLIHAWAIERIGGSYFLPFSHWIYLKEIIHFYDEIILVSPCKKLGDHDLTANLDISNFANVSVYELPAGTGSYVSSVKYFFYFLQAYRTIKGVSTYYSRYPTPFGWLQKIYSSNGAIRILHYVGDPEDATKNNPNFSNFKKIILLSGFSLENSLYTWACKGARVYTNGHHLSDKLSEKGVTAIPLISSTLTESDFHYSKKRISASAAKFLYLGYLRTAKGVETAIRAFHLYNKKYPESTFTIIGSGEFEQNLRTIVLDEGISNIRFLGRIEDREIINAELRRADVFLFASLSEGSPRVILEAMANGLVVISTPVGSLPNFFNDNENIVFANYNDSYDFFNKMVHLMNNEKYFESIRYSSHEKVQGLTLSKFISTIFGVS